MLGTDQYLNLYKVKKSNNNLVNILFNYFMDYIQYYHT